MIIPARRNIIIYQGSEYERAYSWTDADGNVIDLSPYTSARMMVREQYYSPTPVVEATTANGKITINYTTNKVHILLLASETAGYNWKKGFWDLELAYDTTVHRVIMGTAELSPEATK